ncbi:type II toxin-antitoxin system ParD family antitoxin [Ensifer sp.]|uniref:type II toxin-antitoxin system ParD family antitoxin n=1 Tax=Ensifer sp. TaxID=1872086 RepID=UPI000DDB2797|nr:type II toxin-antitoxin system ParD family antitoxin [Ensifer sp.]
MHVSLTDKLDEYVRDKVASGLYNNASEVIREALRQKIATEQSDADKLRQLREALDPAWAQADAGACVPFDLTAILSELDQETAAHA